MTVGLRNALLRDRHRRPVRCRRDAGRVEVDGRDDDALDEHEPFAVVVTAGRRRRIRSRGACHRRVDRVVHITFDDQEPGHSGRDLVVRRSVRVRVIPVRAWRLGLRRARGRRPRTASQDELVVDLTDVLVRLLAARRRAHRLPHRPVVAAQQAHTGVVRFRPAGIQFRRDVQSVRMKIRDARTVFRVRYTGHAVAIHRRDGQKARERLEILQHVECRIGL